ncbi:hypothetical protein CA13_52270 [Planctomycetes bacterium CA13]|uniref:Uncharacterized protein n=1 Tax=Novipirellula herctigrandis TaxID=2527986 RepID=A0A5C5Z9I8_9BACT|nr:hypothetical protein CA13_52270 [Planctomycetes bacterium CA13]
MQLQLFIVAYSLCSVGWESGAKSLVATGSALFRGKGPPGDIVLDDVVPNGMGGTGESAFELLGDAGLRGAGFVVGAVIGGAVIGGAVIGGAVIGGCE